ncbi:hypothetical protein EON63_07305 [archaeon]|nr:MAG: hypothetical protein EON63_07305 [archaeon]
MVDMRGEYYVKRRADMKDIASSVLEQKDFSVSSELESYLSQVGLSQVASAQDAQKVSVNLYVYGYRDCVCVRVCS